MESSTVWLHLVDHKFQALGHCFETEITIDDDIFDLKYKVKEKKPEIFSYYDIEPPCLTVWKMEGELVHNGPTAKCQEEILEKVNINDRDTIQMLDEDEMVAELQLSDSQILLIQLPDLSSDFRVWLLFVDHKFQAMGQPFQVGTFFDDKISNLKNKVKEKKPDIFSLIFTLCKLDPLCLTVWKTEGKLVLNGSTGKHLEEILKKINVDDEDTIQMLDESMTMAELQSSLTDDGQILLAQFPDLPKLLLEQRRSSKVWLLLVDYKFQAVGDVFHVGVSIDDYVSHLKAKAWEQLKVKMPAEIPSSYHHIDPNFLTVWKMEREFAIHMSPTKHLKEVFESISTNTLDERVAVKVAPGGLQLSDDQTLLIRLPPPTTAPISYCVN